MALATERVRLGTTVTAPSRRRPWKLARETVTLDHLSGGRRAVRQSGIVPYKPSRADPYQDADERLSAAEVAGIRDVVERERGSAAGSTSSSAAAGAGRTGTPSAGTSAPSRTRARPGGEWVPPGPVEEMRQAVEAGR